MTDPVEAYYQQQARFARMLIDACQGTCAAAEAVKLSEGTVSRYRNPIYKAVMPLPVIMALQEHCGRPVYTQALTDLVTPAAPGELQDDVCQSVEDAAAILSTVRARPKGAGLTPRERDALHRLVAMAKEHLEQVDRDIDAGGVTPIRRGGA